MAIGARIGVVIVRSYQLLVSPFTGGVCRFEPSCSAYAVDALEQHGFWRGMLLAVRRVSRCHPLGSSGFDPVPPRAGDR